MSERIVIGNEDQGVRAAEAEVVRAAEAYADAVEAWERIERHAVKGSTLLERHERLHEASIAVVDAVAALRRERERAGE